MVHIDRQFTTRRYGVPSRRATIRDALLMGIGLLSLTACGKTLYPVTAGSYKMLPKQPAQVVVWGPDHDTDPAQVRQDALHYRVSDAMAAVTRWLQKRRLLVVERRILLQVLESGAGPADEAALRRAASLLGIDELIFVEATRLAVPPQETAERNRNPPAALHMTSVSIRGVEAKTGDVLWNAYASFPPTDVERDDAVTYLACQALATVWGFRPAGYHEVASPDMCEFKEQDHYGPHSPRYHELG
jgi:hypothetical protein